MVEMLEPEFDPQDRNKVQRKAMVTVMANEIGKQQALLRAILYFRRVRVIRCTTCTVSQHKPTICPQILRLSAISYRIDYLVPGTRYRSTRYNACLITKIR